MALEINLLPEKVKKEKTVKMAYTYLIGVAILIVAVLILLVFNEQQKVTRLDAEIAKVQAEENSLTDKIEEVKKFDVLEASYSKKKAIIDKLLKKQAIWPELLDRIGMLVLPDMWLTSIKYIKEKENGFTIDMTGNALSEIIIGDFIKKLEQSQYLTDVTTLSMKDTNNQSTGLSFEVSVFYKTD